MYKVVVKFVEKLFKYGIMFKEILTFSGLDCRDAFLIKLYFTVIKKIKSIG